MKLTDVISVVKSGISQLTALYYCIRPQFCKGNALNVSLISGIPNTLSTYDDGYRPPVKAETTFTLNGKKYKIMEV